ncbi:hypothetical protein [Streptomyces sp. C36]|uniref:hypothetical protein n=1 Tax=Streptomyces sp. C36 TaxID=3237122 RepID=UPI0034C646B4
MTKRDGKAEQAREEIEADLKDDPEVTWLARDIIAVVKKHRAAERKHATEVAARLEGARQVAGAEAADAEAAEHLTLAEAGRIRRAYKVAQTATPRLILDANSNGLNATEIARELDVSGSYVARFLRENGRQENPEGSQG